ncbi:MAG: Asp-tRNA(Asn)/Glu-tRNA(Gln) amidotransferase subunit GatA [Candidatus Pacebacteria bacterium]|nr:Asp-tRNA(Asn)/Glu-tRNA(Gln) amidotransferase subunit GatA [Candidatus Paceibacterota bacterium]
MAVIDIEKLTIPKVRAALDAGEYSAVALAEAFLARIKEREGLNAYLEVFDDVIEQANAADELIAEGKPGPLTGIPLGVKDNILIKGRKVSAASKMLENYTATYDATVIKKLKEQRVVFLGRTNLDEFAMGASTENSAFGVTKNPHDETRVAGGSSGGSAAAVGGVLALAALGSDTGGSIRQPASLCGVVGLKPTYGAVSRLGLIAMGSSFDQIGPITHTVDGAEMIFNAIRGNDPKDSTSTPDSFYTEVSKKPKKIGVPRALLEEGVDPDVLENFEGTLAKLEADGYEIVDIELPNAKYALAAYYIIIPAEVSTNLSRFDGVRYGLHFDGTGVDDEYAKSRSAGFGPEVRRRILLGTHVLSAGYYDAYYNKAQALRGLIRKDYEAALEKVDVIATPTSPIPAFKIGEKSDPLSMYLLDIFTVTANLTGMPAISVPSGTVDREGSSLPVGIQFLAPAFHEKYLFDAGRSVEA